MDTTPPAIPLPDPAAIVLPPYSGEHSTCPVCSNPGAFTLYRPAIATPAVQEYNGRTMRRGPLPARLERRCIRCDYQYDEALWPTPGARLATAEDVLTVLQHSYQGWEVDLARVADELLRAFHVHVPAGAEREAPPTTHTSGAGS